MKKLFNLFIRALNPKNWKSLYNENKEICRYIFFGVLTTIVSFGTYFIFRNLFPDEESVPSWLRWIFSLSAVMFGAESNTALPNLLSWVCAVTFAYVTNRIWVFESKARGFIKILKEIALFYGARVLTLAVDLIIMYLLIDVTGIENGIYELFAKVLSNVVVLTLNYILSKLFVFKKH